MKSETDVKREIAKYLDSLGPQCWHVPFHNMGYTRAGIPDRLCCYRGRFFAIEAKRPPIEGKKAPKPKAWQRRELAAIIEAGGRAIVAWTVDHVREEIEAIDYETRKFLEDDDYEEKERCARESF